MSDNTASEPATVPIDATDLIVQTPVKAKPPKAEKPPTAVPRKSLVENTELVDKVLQNVRHHFDSIKSARTEHEDIWEVADWMFKCGQDDTITQTERTRVDRQSSSTTDTKTKTKSQKIGSTLFFRQVRSLASHLVDIKDSGITGLPFKLVSRRNPEVEHSEKQAEELAAQHNTLMRWTLDEEDFDIKFVDFIFQLLKEGNVPVFARWKRESKEVLDNWPLKKRDADGTLRTKRMRKQIRTDNRPVLDFLANEHFFAYPNIADMQHQPCIITQSMTSTQGLWSQQRQGEFTNVTKVGQEHVFTGIEDNTDLAQQRELNEGLASSIGGTHSASFIQWDAHAYMPIDETKSKGKMWNAAEHEPKIYWSTWIGDLSSGKVVCVRLERNRDPDDEHPFRMIHMFPGDANKLYHMGLAQALRGDYIEQSTTKAQIIDAGTLANNRPLKIKGVVQTADGTFQYKKDQIFLLEDDAEVEEFQIAPVQDNYQRIAYFDNDADETAGNNRTMRAEPLGGRTSSAEATNAANAGQLPIQMVAKYIFNQLFKWYPRKAIRMWHLYADDDQILKITDENGVQQVVKPFDLFGDFDTRIDIVHEYEKSMLTQRNMGFVASTLMPLFSNVVDMRSFAKPVFQDTMRMDITPHLLPDNREASITRARTVIHEIVTNLAFTEPNPQDDLNAQLAEFKGARTRYRGMEDDSPQVIEMLDRWIAIAEDLLKSQQPNVGSQAAPPTAETEGQLVGDNIAAAIGGAP